LGFFLQRGEKKEIKTEVYYSRMNEIELKGVIVKRLLFAEAVKANLPTRVAQDVILSSELQSSFQKDIDAKVSNLVNLLKTNNVGVYCCDDPQEFSDSFQSILEIVHILQKRISMSPFDLYIYSCALQIQVDAILSSDSEFSDIIKALNQPSKKGWREVRDSIVKEASNLVSSGISKNAKNVNKMKFPKHLRIGELKYDKKI